MVAGKSASEIQVEQLTEFVSRLQAEQKAKESAIKHLNEQMAIADAELIVKLTSVQDAYRAKVEELQAALIPLQALRNEIPRLQAEIADLKQRKLDVAAEIRQTRGQEIQDANLQLQAATGRLAQVEVAIARCKASVAAL